MHNFNFMKKIIVGLSVIALFFSGCSKESSFEEDSARLNELLDQLEYLSTSVSCENEEDWLFTPYGAKACGGPQGYIAYSLSLNVSEYLELVEEHRLKEDEFNTKWGIISPCDIPPYPQDVVCENGLPSFLF